MLLSVHFVMTWHWPAKFSRQVTKTSHGQIVGSEGYAPSSRTAHPSAFWYLANIGPVIERGKQTIKFSTADHSLLQRKTRKKSCKRSRLPSTSPTRPPLQATWRNSSEIRMPRLRHLKKCKASSQFTTLNIEDLIEDRFVRKLDESGQLDHQYAAYGKK